MIAAVSDWAGAMTGNVCMVTGGHNLGRVGLVTHRERHHGGFDIVHIKDSLGHQFATRWVARTWPCSDCCHVLTINIVWCGVQWYNVHCLNFRLSHRLLKCEMYLFCRIKYTSENDVYSVIGRNVSWTANNFKCLSLKINLISFKTQNCKWAKKNVFSHQITALATRDLVC